MKIALTLLFFLCVNTSLLSQISWDVEYPPGTTTISRQVRPYRCQLYPRNLDNLATVRCNGTLSNGYTGINFQVRKAPKGGTPVYSDVYHLIVSGSRHFNFAYDIMAELSEYTFYYQLEYSNHPMAWNILADSVVCGDVFIIDGQSNATTDGMLDASTLNLLYGYTSEYGEYSRTFGHMGRTYPYDYWGMSRESLGNNTFRVGVWGLYIQHEIARKYKIPTCIINGAEGGTSIIRHVLNSAPYFTDSLFGCTNYKAFKARIENNIKAIFFYQGESDVHMQTSREEYYIHFDSLYTDWHTYFPGYNKTYVVQIHAYPGCPPTDEIHGFQRELPAYFPDLEVMSSNGILYQDNIHFFSAGYLNLGKRLLQLLERDWYCQTQGLSLYTPPDIKRIITLPVQNGTQLIFEFNQEIEIIGNQFSQPLSTIYIDDVSASNTIHQISSCTIQGNKYVITSSIPGWDPQSVSYLNTIPSTSYNYYIRNGNTSDPAFDVAAYSFKETVPFYGTGTVTQNYLKYPYPPYSKQIDVASGLLSGIILEDRKAFELFNKVSNQGYAEIPITANIDLKAANRIYLNPGFTANYGSRVRLLVGDDLYAFTSENNCELFPLTGNLAFKSDVVEPDWVIPYEPPLELANEETLVVFPNPSFGEIHLKYTFQNDMGKFILYGAQGQELMSYKLSNEYNEDYLIEENLAPGIYFYRAVSGMKVVSSGKLIIQ